MKIHRNGWARIQITNRPVQKLKKAKEAIESGNVKCSIHKEPLIWIQCSAKIRWDFKGIFYLQDNIVDNRVIVRHMGHHEHACPEVRV